MNGMDMSLLSYRLKQCGFKPVQFSYPTVRYSLKDNAKKLQRFVQQLEKNTHVDTVHFVAHSMGGLLLRQFFQDYPDQYSGRVVTLGTPHQGSQVARRMGCNPFGKLLLGESYSNGLCGDVPSWNAQRDMAVFAGKKSIGIGRLILSLPRPNDGTVAVAETYLDNAKLHRVFPTTHMGLLVSSEVAQAVCGFLREGVI